MEEKSWKVGCRIVGCTWVKAFHGSAVGADDALGEHILKDHTHREVVELLVSSWSGDSIDKPVSSLTLTESAAAGETEALKKSLEKEQAQVAHLREAMGLMDAKMAKLSKQLAAKGGPVVAPAAEGRLRDALMAAPFGRPLREICAEVLQISAGLRATRAQMNEAVRVHVGMFLVETGRIEMAMRELVAAGSARDLDGKAWELIPRRRHDGDEQASGDAAGRGTGP